jgi:hypothetical protein
MLKQQKAVEQKLARLRLLLMLCPKQTLWAGERVCMEVVEMADNNRSRQLSNEPHQLWQKQQHLQLVACGALDRLRFVWFSCRAAGVSACCCIASRAAAWLVAC